MKIERPPRPDLVLETYSHFVLSRGGFRKFVITDRMIALSLYLYEMGVGSREYFGWAFNRFDEGFCARKFRVNYPPITFLSGKSIVDLYIKDSRRDREILQYVPGSAVRDDVTPENRKLMEEVENLIQDEGKHYAGI